MKTLITGALALALLASAAPAALAQDRPDRQNEEGGRGPGAGHPQEHQAPPQHQAPPPAAAQPAPKAAGPLMSPAGQPQGQPQGQPMTRGYFRQDGQGAPGGYRGSDGRGRGLNPGAQTAPGTMAPLPWHTDAPPQGQPQGQGREGRHENRDGSGSDAGRSLQGGLPAGVRDDRNRQDDHRWQDNGRRDDGRRDDGRRYDDRGRGDQHGYNSGRAEGRDWQRDRPRYDRHDYPFQFSEHQRYRGFSYYPPRGFYARHWLFGDIVPRSWWAPDYRISEWWAYGLPIPPLGYEWVRVGDDALLVDIYSGRVVQVAYDIFY